MKKSIFILMAVVLGITACNEKDFASENNESFDNSSISVEEQGPILTIKGKPYRAVEKRDRDGETCDCKFCFGICDAGFDIKIPLPNFAVAPNISPTKAKIYVLEDYAHAESEFGLDFDITFPGSALSGTNINNLILKTGVYTYTPQTEDIIADGITRTSYGYILVDKFQN